MNSGHQDLGDRFLSNGREDVNEDYRDSSVSPSGAQVADGHRFRSPLFILGVPRSFTSVVCAMLGQHPQMYGLPELHLFTSQTLEERKNVWAQSTFNINHGLLRVIAELYFGKQTEETVIFARAWLRRRADWTTGFLLEDICRRVAPRIVVEKSPSNVRDMTYLKRINRFFPQARFIHLIRHPVGHARSLDRYARNRERNKARLRRQQKLGMRRIPRQFLQPGIFSDPQRVWYRLNTNICEFLQNIEPDRKLRIRGEELLATPYEYLQQIAEWMRVRTDNDAIQAMMHPEASPYACFGPAGARGGADPEFLARPAIHEEKRIRLNLLPDRWPENGRPWLPKVKQLAQSLGYE